MGLFEPALKRKRPSGPSDSASAAVAVGDVAVLDEPDDQADDAPEASDTGTIRELRNAWAAVIARIMESEKQLGSFLRHTEIVGHREHSVTLGVPDDFHVRALRADRARLAHRLMEASGLHIDRIRFTVRPRQGTNDDAIAESERDAREFLRTLCEENPAVRALVERFGGEIVW
jgi:hypothetical protein